MKFDYDIAQRYMGTIDRAWTGYATDASVREGAASGGVVTALLLHLLATGRIDAALVTRIVCRDGRIDAEVFLARTPEEVLTARTSKYFDVPLISQGVPLLRRFEGRVAVVALPCHTTALRRLAKRDPDLQEKLACIITLFCNHSSEHYLLDKVLEKEGIDQSQVEEFSFRRGHWRGRMCGRLRDGRTFAFPFQRFSYYHNLHLFGSPRCLHCSDHMGYESAISAGDAWLREMKSNPIKHSIFFSRHPQATALIEEMVAQGALLARPTDEATVFRSQKRALIYHYNVTARARAARRYGLSLRDTVGAPVRWNDALAARMILFNHRWSHDPHRRDWIFQIPRPIVTAWFLFLKLLQNF